MGVKYNPFTGKLQWYSSGSTPETIALGELSDVDTSAEATNDVIMFNGSEWVPVPEGTTFSFSIASFSDGQSSPQEIGSGEWKAIGALSFTATYNNGPATDGYVTQGAWSNLTLEGAGFVGPTVSVEAVNYPAAPGSLFFVLHAAKSAETDTDTEVVSFYNRIYWGVSTKTGTYLEADVEGLATNAISNTKGRTFTETPDASSYIIYALPTRLGTVTFWVGGFEGGFQAPETVSVTNASGFTENYYVYRSTNSGLGETEVTVV